MLLSYNNVEQEGGILLKVFEVEEEDAVVTVGTGMPEVNFSQRIQDAKNSPRSMTTGEGNWPQSIV